VTRLHVLRPDVFQNSIVAFFMLPVIQSFEYIQKVVVAANCVQQFVFLDSQEPVVLGLAYEALLDPNLLLVHVDNF